MFSTQELQNNCIVSSELGMQFTPLNKVKLSASMQRVNTTWQGRAVTYAFFPQSRSTWTNTHATLVAGVTIRGNAILVGVTTDEIFAAQTPVKSWASLASKFPKVVPLDALARNRLAREHMDRLTAWREYYQRKADRRKNVNYNTATVNLRTGEVLGELTEAEQLAADAADAAFAEWNVEEDLLE